MDCTICTKDFGSKDKKKAYNKDSSPKDKVEKWRRACGCIKTSEKLKRILQSFPEPPPPTPAHGRVTVNYRKHEVGYPPNTVSKRDPQGFGVCHRLPSYPKNTAVYLDDCVMSKFQGETATQVPNRCCRSIVREVVSLIQTTVSATALAIYYLIYLYMQLVYITLSSAIYFHQADGPMKLTIVIVTITSMVIGSNIIRKIERILRLVL